MAQLELIKHFTGRKEGDLLSIAIECEKLVPHKILRIYIIIRTNYIQTLISENVLTSDKNKK